MQGTIRLATAADAESIARIYAPYVAGSPVSFETEVPGAAEMARRITETLVTHPWLVYTEQGIVGGYAYATKHRVRAAYQWSVEASVYVDEAFRRRRIGQALYTSLFAILEAQGFVVAYGGITLPNPASVGLHESLGFEPIGVYPQIGFKAGAWHDVGWWQLTVGPRVSTPSAPRPLAEIVAAPGFDAMVALGLPLVRASREERV